MSLLDNPIHLAFVLVLVLLVFGAKRVPEMGRSLGTGMRGFRDALAGESTSQSHAAELTPARAVALQASVAAQGSDAAGRVPAESATRAQPVASSESAESATRAQPVASSESAESATRAQPVALPE